MYALSRFIDGVGDHGVVAGRDGNKWEWPRHQFVVVLQHQVLGTHLQ